MGWGTEERLVAGVFAREPIPIGCGWRIPSAFPTTALAAGIVLAVDSPGSGAFASLAVPGWPSFFGRMKRSSQGDEWVRWSTVRPVGWLG